MINVGILGSTGYAGAELVRLLSSHKDVNIKFLDSRTYDKEEYTNPYPHLKNKLNKVCKSINIFESELLDEVDIVFCALPHGLSQDAVKVCIAKGKKIIDLSADFRIKDPFLYEKWYKTTHNAKEELKSAVYGLTEIYREKIKSSTVIANPGCYPTSILLALYPLLKENIISSKGIIADSKSGVSGAGRNIMDSNLFSQCNENIRGYSIGEHRHIPEIEQEIAAFAEEEASIQFTPHLVPLNRGILSTIYADNKKGVTQYDLEDIYGNYYKGEYFVRLFSRGELPQTKGVSGSNFCDIGLKVDQRTGKIIIVSAIDNLIKGAAGQAVQNMNLLFNLKENSGLEQMPLWP